MKRIDMDEQASARQIRIREKPALQRLYRDIYLRYRSFLTRCPQRGLALEIGAGVGFAKDVIPELLTSDVRRYPTVDCVFDARHMPFADATLRGICMLNTFHHISDVKAFLREAVRCLTPGGRMLIIDQYPGWLARWILKYGHEEPFQPNAAEWRFASRGDLGDANGALCWIVFWRDRHQYEDLFPELRVLAVEPNMPFRYWLSGGIKPWTLLPECLYGFAKWMDVQVARRFPQACSFVDVELVRV